MSRKNLKDRELLLLLLNENEDLKQEIQLLKTHISNTIDAQTEEIKSMLIKHAKFLIKEINN